MFALGVELSIRSLGQVKAAAVFAAPLQIIFCVGMGQAVGMLLGWPSNQALVLGFILALSSTMVVVKLLSEQGELHTQHGRVMVAMLLVQDLAAVIMVGLLPVLYDIELRDSIELSKTIGKGAVFIGWTIIMARWIAPALLRIVVRSYSKEIFIAMAAVICFGGAASSYLLGFSLALGAFVAGLVLSESQYSHEVLANVTPMRDLFGMVFFISLGLLFDWRAAWMHPGWTLALLASIFIGKALAVAVSVLLARYHIRTALISGLGLAQIGEFSFLVAILAMRAGLLSQDLHSLIVGVAVVSFLASPALMKLGTALYGRMRSWPAGDAVFAEEEFSRGKRRPPRMENHVILCGYGRVGSHIGEMLLEEKQPFLVIEYDHRIVTALQERNLPVLYGDSTSRLLLQVAAADRARLAVIALPDAISTRLTVRELRRINPDLPIVARVHLSEELEPTCAEGAHEVVQAEFEASLELMRHSLLRLGRDMEKVQARIDAIRQQRYQKLRNGECLREEIPVGPEV
jgi:CPA2 family monovalent cation:H+ antiporter-2